MRKERPASGGGGGGQHRSMATREREARQASAVAGEEGQAATLEGVGASGGQRQVACVAG